VVPETSRKSWMGLEGKNNVEIGERISLFFPEQIKNEDELDDFLETLRLELFYCKVTTKKRGWPSGI
jgi:hypothetical protein